MKKNVYVLMVSSALLAGMIVAGHAQGIDPPNRSTRIDAGGFYHSFSEGDDRYGPWWGLRFKATNRPPAGMLGATGIFELATENRRDTGNERSGVYAAAGGYYDWNERFYTFSSLGLGTGEPFVRFNVHNEINMKVFHDRQVMGIGAGFIDYDNVNGSSYLSLGTTYFWRGMFESNQLVMLQYNFRLHFSNPVDEKPGTHVFAVTFGGDGRWTRAIFLRGRDQFRTGGGTLPQLDADLTGNIFTLEHETPLNEQLGIVVGLDFMSKSRTLDDRTLFSGPGVEIGFFWNL